MGFSLASANVLPWCTTFGRTNTVLDGQAGSEGDRYRVAWSCRICQMRLAVMGMSRFLTP